MIIISIIDYNASAAHLQSLLFEISPLDPIAFIAASILLITAAVLAASLPSRSASSADPITTLRDS